MMNSAAVILIAIVLAAALVSVVFLRGRKPKGTSASGSSCLSLPNDVLFGFVKELVDEKKRVVITPKGNSMLPYIRGDRDKVVIATPEADPRKGDIVLAKIEDRFIIHRIVSIDGARLTLMGDGNIRETEKCEKTDVLGVVTEILRNGSKRVKPGKGRLWRFLRPFRRIILAVYKRVVL